MLSPTHVNVNVHRAFNLKTKGKAGTNDAYVVIQLGNDSYRTSTKERTTEPIWNEEYMFPLPLDSRNSDVIRVSVFHRNLLSLDDLLGLTEIPLYKVRDRERARPRRYVLYEKLPLRNSFSKGGKSRRRGSEIMESPSTEDLSVPVTPATPGTPEIPLGSGENPMARAEIELTITFTQERAKESHNILRPRAVNRIENEEKTVRRRSMPSALNLPAVEPQQMGDVKRRNRHSIMSVFEAPLTLLNTSMRRSATCSMEDMSSLDAENVSTGKEPEKNVKANEVKNRNRNAGFFDECVENINKNQTSETFNATNNVRPTEIRFSVDSPGCSPAVTPASSWRSESVITSPEAVLTPDSQISTTETETEEMMRDDEDLRRFQRERRRYTRAVRKLPGFMTIDSQEKISRYQPSNDEINLFCGYNREELISTVIRQHARLALAEAYIGDLEHCINNLVLRALDSQPRLLQTPYTRQQSEPVVTSSKRPAFLKVTKKILKSKISKNKITE